MKEFWIGVLGGVLLTVATVAPRLWGSPTYGKIIRDCSLTGAHVIDNDTVVVCQVLSRTTTPTPQPQNKKPEISL